MSEQCEPEIAPPPHVHELNQPEEDPSVHELMNPKTETETVDPPGSEQNEDPPDSELICKIQKCENQSEVPLMREVDICWNEDPPERKLAWKNSEKRNKDPPPV